MLIDFQAHWTPPAHFAALESRRDYPRARRLEDGTLYVEYSAIHARPIDSRFYDLDVHFADMEAHGVDVMVSSPSLSDVARLSLEEAVHLTNRLNEEAGRAQERWPDRFVGLAVLPLGHPAAAVGVLRRAIEDSGLRGVCLTSNVGGVPLVRPESMPVFDAIAEYDVPIVLHPTTSMLAGLGVPDAVERGLSWMTDTSTAALSLIYTGMLDRHPGLRVLHPHAGGVVPYIVGRMGLVEEDVSDERPRDSMTAYVRRNFFTDSVNDTEGALEMALRTFGAGRVLYGSDFPYVKRGVILSAIRRLTASDRASVFEATGPGGLVQTAG